MLDRIQLLKELERVSQALFYEDTQPYDTAIAAWKTLSSDQTFQEKARQAAAPFPIPSWSDDLATSYPISSLDSYSVCSIDGSQIYPDRHQGVSCFLINIGSVILRYGSNLKPVEFTSKPYMYTGQEEELELEISVELVNCKRQELELQSGVVLCKEKNEESMVLLFDGSLIFWHLEAKDLVFRDAYLSKYIVSLLQLHKQKISTASYISAPKSRELINLIKLHLSNFDHTNISSYQHIERLADGGLLTRILPLHHRSIIFKNNSSISQFYPDSVHPYFFYINVGFEIGRVEIPAWVAHDQALVNHVASVILDQSIKGGGYPVALAEAHEQAVVKGPDRDFFYHLFMKMSLERKQRFGISYKLRKKKGLGI